MKAIFNIGYTTAIPPKSYTGNRRAEYIAQRKFYDLTAEYNHFDYMLKGDKVAKNANAEHYFTREGTNTGLFNLEGFINEDKKAEIKARLKDSKSTIWHGFISFDDETSRGFTTQEKCIKFMRQTFGGFLERAGFKKSNIELFCSLHEDTEHRHIHFSFFEKEPIRLDKNGELGFTRKGKIKSEAIDNYLVSANMHLSEHSDEYWSTRDAAIAEMHRLCDIKSRTGFIDGRASTVSLLANAEINALCAKLPATGRLQYNSKDMEKLRPQIDRVAELLIRSDTKTAAAHGEMLKQLARIEEETKRLAADGKLGYLQGARMTASDVAAAMGDGVTRNQSMDIGLVDMNKIDYFERLKNDYKARIGNVVLKMCKEVNYLQTYEKRRYRVNERHRKIEAKRRRGYRRDLMLQAQSAIGAICRMENANFLKTVQQHERDIAYENAQANNNMAG